MAFMDNTLSFSTNWATAQAVSVNNSTVNSTNVVDLTGAGSGNAPAMINGFPSLNTAMGFDIGAGDGIAIPYLFVGVTVAGTGAGGLSVVLQEAPDNGSFSPGTYTTVYQSAAVTGSNLTVGSYLIVPVPPTLFAFPPGANREAIPRFLRLQYTSTGIATVSAVAGLMLNPPSSLLLPQYNNNFTVV